MAERLSDIEPGDKVRPHLSTTVYDVQAVNKRPFGNQLVLDNGAVVYEDETWGWHKVSG